MPATTRAQADAGEKAEKANCISASGDISRQITEGEPARVQYSGFSTIQKPWAQMNAQEQQLALALSSIQSAGIPVETLVFILEAQGTLHLKKNEEEIFYKLPLDAIFVQTSESKISKILEEHCAADTAALVASYVGARVPAVTEHEHQSFVCSLNVFSWFALWQLTDMPTPFLDADLVSLFGGTEGKSRQKCSKGRGFAICKQKTESVALRFYKARMMGKALSKSVGSTGRIIDVGADTSAALYDVAIHKARQFHKTLTGMTPEELAADDDWAWWVSMCSFLGAGTGMGGHPLQQSFLTNNVQF